MSDAIAAALYGTPTPAAPAAPAPEPAAAPLRSRAESLNDSSVTAKLYGPTPAPAPAQRDPADEQAATDALYEAYTLTEAGKSTYGSMMRELVSADVNRLGTEQVDAEANATEVATVFEHFGVNSSDAAYITEVAVAAAANGISEEQDASNHSAAMDVLRTDYGPEGAQRAMQLAQRLVAQHPGLRAYLAESGLGNHPKVVSTVAQRAWQLAAAGKL